MIVTCRQMQEIEEAAFQRGITAGDLMDDAGRGIANVVRQFFPQPGTMVLFLGKGNNAGDALVAARELQKLGWRICARLAFPKGDFKELPAKHWQALAPHVGSEIDAGPLVLLDGLLGIGATGPLTGNLRVLAEEMNALRKNKHATTIALDIPSGLDGDTGVVGAGCVEADVTATIAHVKAGLLADSATAHVGRLAVVSLKELASDAGDSSSAVLTASVLREKLPRRSFDFHKSNAGRVGIIAGSRGYIGAGLLAAIGALRGGAGLVTLFVKADVYSIMASKAPMEVMVRVINDYRDVLAESFDALAIGPGLGFQSQDEVLDVIRRAETPLVIDADALTVLARADMSSVLPSSVPRLLTPHPGEMSRFFAQHPQWQNLNRRALAEAFARSYPGCALLLKGARTVIAQSGATTCFNTTGTPAMATGGMGDVLTGLSAALVAQGMSCFDAGCLGAWLSGRAAEIAITHGGQSIESLAAGDVLHHLGAAFGDLKAGVY
jgi:ADP-dependent NAD(P)H-hydrate dehydratase / NAD(P)H-hydrate epimerase